MAKNLDVCGEDRMRDVFQDWLPCDGCQEQVAGCHRSLRAAEEEFHRRVARLLGLPDPPLPVRIEEALAEVDRRTGALRDFQARYSDHLSDMRYRGFCNPDHAQWVRDSSLSFLADLEEVVQRSPTAGFSDASHTAPSTRSENVFPKLHKLAKRLPMLRPGQILAVLDMHVPTGVNAFHWEVDEWEDHIEHAHKLVSQWEADLKRGPPPSQEGGVESRRLNDLFRRVAEEAEKGREEYRAYRMAKYGHEAEREPEASNDHREGE